MCPEGVYFNRVCVCVCVCPAGVVLPVCPVHSEDYSSLEMPSVCVRKWLNNGARKGPPLHITTQDIRLLNLGGLFHYFPVYVKKWQENNKLPSKWTLLIHIFFFLFIEACLFNLCDKDAYTVCKVGHLAMLAEGLWLLCYIQ